MYQQGNYIIDRPQDRWNLGDELTDDEAMAIVKAEVMKIPATEMAKILVGDLTPLNTAVKNSVRQICLAGGKKEIMNYVPWVAAAVGGMVLLYLILK